MWRRRACGNSTRATIRAADKRGVDGFSAARWGYNLHPCLPSSREPSVNHFLAACVALLLSVVALQASAADTVPAVDPAIAKAIVARMQAARPDLSYEVLRPSPIPGFYEVQVAGGPVLYVREGGEYFFDGALYQARPGMFVNLREQDLIGKRKQALAALPVSDMIVYSPVGKPKATISVFTDIDCGYCRKLHKSVPELNAMGIEVRYLAFPRAGLGSGSYRKAVTAWCSDNRQETLTRLKNGEDVPEKLCENNPVAAQFELGQELGVSGTPASILSDGTLIPGFRSAADVASILGVDTTPPAH
jgi:thiol:disulfide interchange protein DsbC